MIDVWLLFGLILPFLGFILSIFEELVAQAQEDADTGRVKVELQNIIFNISKYGIPLGGWIPDQGDTYGGQTVTGKTGAAGKHRRGATILRKEGSSSCHGCLCRRLLDRC